MADYFEIKLNSKEVSPNIVTRVEYAESIEHINSLMIEMSVPYSGAKTPFIGSVLPGIKYQVNILSAGKPVQKLEGDVVDVEYRQMGKMTRVTVFGLDPMHRLDLGTAKAKMWEETHTNIVKKIAKAAGLKVEAHAAPGAKGFIFQENVSDGAFVKKLAAQHNFYLSVQDKKLKFVRRKAAGSPVKVDLEKVDADVRMRISVSGVVTSVEAFGYDYMQEKLFKHKAVEKDMAKISGGDTAVKIAKKAFGEIPMVLNHTGLNNLSAVKAYAAAVLQQRNQRFVQGTMTTRGLPTAKAGATLDVTNGSWPLTGKFLIRSVRHIETSGDGYRTLIEFCSDSLSKKK